MLKKYDHHIEKILKLAGYDITVMVSILNDWISRNQTERYRSLGKTLTLSDIQGASGPRRDGCPDQEKKPTNQNLERQFDRLTVSLDRWVTTRQCWGIVAKLAAIEFIAGAIFVGYVYWQDRAEADQFRQSRSPPAVHGPAQP
jgi:hypothetical protein